MILFLVVLVIVVVAFVITSSRPDYVERAKAATFELGVRAYFAVSYDKEMFEATFPKYQELLGAVLVNKGDHPRVGRFALFYVPVGSGSAFFFGKPASGMNVYALTNMHVIDTSEAVDTVRRMNTVSTLKLYDLLYDSWTVLCPNFTKFDEPPTCNADPNALSVEYGNHELDFVVIAFKYLDPLVVKSVVILPLGDDRLLQPGDRVVTIGAALGIQDIVGEGRILDASVPYFLDDPKWRWVRPYDMNTVGGFSGSPVVDPVTGRVVGLHRGALADPRGSGRALGLYIPMWIIRQNLALAGFPVGELQLK